MKKAILAVVILIACAMISAADNPKFGCRSDAKKGYTEGFDAAVELARSSCERIVDEHRVGDCKQVLYELYKQDKPN
jgi:predicted small secreted protein